MRISIIIPYANVLSWYPLTRLINMFNVSVYVSCPVLPLSIVAVSVGNRVEEYGNGHASVTFQIVNFIYEHDLPRVTENR